MDSSAFNTAVSRANSTTNPFDSRHLLQGLDTVIAEVIHRHVQHGADLTPVEAGTPVDDASSCGLQDRDFYPRNAARRPAAPDVLPKSAMRRDFRPSM